MKKILKFLALSLLPVAGFSQAEILVMGSQKLVMSGGSSGTPIYLVVDNPSTGAIVPGTGAILSESEFNMVQWNIGTGTGLYSLPFVDANGHALPLTMNILSNPGEGSGVVKFSTWHTVPLNSTPTYAPSDVNNFNAFITPGNPSNADNSYYLVDRFYVIDANTGYTTKPAPDNITFSYVSGALNSEVGSPNTITESHLMAQHYNSTTNTWSDWFGNTCSDAVVSNIGTVQTGAVDAADMYRSWSLWDHTMSLPTKITLGGNACNGANATATIYGGAAPYTYSWNDNSSQSTATATGLSSGTYTVTVSDANHCSSTVAVAITEPTPLVNVVYGTPTSCRLTNDGSASVFASGGVHPYTYAWSTGTTSNIISNHPTASSLSAGTYTITVTDINGCSTTNSEVIGQPAPLTAIMKTLDNIACKGSNTGVAQMLLSGGKAPYTYSWSCNTNTSYTCTSFTAEHLIAGTYTCVATDKCSSSVSATTVITEPATALTQVFTSTNPKCYGDNSGNAVTTVSGGNTPYNYVWYGNPSTTNQAVGLTAGGYNVTVTDANGCSIVKSFSLVNPPALVPAILSQSCVTGVGGKVTITQTGGRSPFTYNWSNGVTTATASALSNGTYSVTVEDRTACTGTIQVTVSGCHSPEGGEGNSGVKDCCPLSDISVYPNPNNGQFTVSGLDKGMSLVIYDYLGKEVSKITASDITMQLNLSNQANGVYLIRIINTNGNLVGQKKVVKTE